LRDRHLVRRAVVLSAALVTTWLVLLAGAGQAFAHAELVSTKPTNGQRLATAPPEVELAFTEPVDLGLGAVKILDSSGQPVRTGALAHPRGDTSTVLVPVRGELADGVYAVIWQVTSSDSHPVRGTFTFTVGDPPAAGGDPQGPAAGTGSAQGSTGTAAVGEGQTVSLIGVLSGVARVAAFVGLALCVGTAYFLVVCWPAGRRHPRAMRLLRYGVVGLAGATVAGLLFYGPYVAALPVGAMGRPSLLAETLHTRLGVAYVVRLVLLAVLAAGCWLLLRRRSVEQEGEARSRACALCGAGVIGGAAALAATWSVANHSAAGTQVPVTIVADVVHLVAMAVWLGGLVVPVLCCCPAGGSMGCVRPYGGSRRQRWSASVHSRPPASTRRGARSEASPPSRAPTTAASC
jgi:copper transport protein